MVIFMIGYVLFVMLKDVGIGEMRASGNMINDRYKILRTISPLSLLEPYE